MLFDITTESESKILYAQSIPPDLKGYEIPGAGTTVIYGSFGQMLIQRLPGKEPLTTVWYNRYVPEKEEHFLFRKEGPHLELQFALSNTFHFKRDGLEEKPLQQGCFNMLYVPLLSSRISLHPGQTYSLFSIIFHPAYLDAWISYYPILQEFLKKIKAAEPVILCAANQVISMPMDIILKQIMENPFSGTAKQIYTDTKVKELFMLVLDKVTHHPTLAHAALRQDEVEQFYGVKETLLKNLQNPMSLKEIARRFGLNTKKLKNGFKQLYETTPFHLMLKARMEKAKILLTETDLCIADIAEVIGYDNKYSFSKAFKKYFGYPPGRCRSSGNDSFDKYPILDN